MNKEILLGNKQTFSLLLLSNYLALLHTNSDKSPSTPIKCGIRLPPCDFCCFLYFSKKSRNEVPPAMSMTRQAAAKMQTCTKFEVANILDEADNGQNHNAYYY